MQKVWLALYMVKVTRKVQTIKTKVSELYERAKLMDNIHM